MTSRPLQLASFVALMALVSAPAAQAQGRSVGRKGAKSLSVNLSISAQRESQPSYEIDSRGNLVLVAGDHWSGNYQSFLEVGRFVTDNLVVDVGESFFGTIGSGTVSTGLNGGVRYYLTPAAAVSPYVSGGGGVFITHSEADTSSAGLIFGSGGLESAVRDNATVFFEGTFERQFASGGGRNSIRAAVGLRILF